LQVKLQNVRRLIIEQGIQQQANTDIAVFAEMENDLQQLILNIGPNIQLMNTILADIQLNIE
jgi:hypothetical protein